MSLSEFRVHLLNCDGEALECVQIKFVKEFIKEILSTCEQEDYDVMIKDGDGEISISLVEFIKRKAGKELTE